ncbi:MAG: ribbon-helix-helix domain-containing protein [Steroidobacteraceae bacterium]
MTKRAHLAAALRSATRSGEGAPAMAAASAAQSAEAPRFLARTPSRVGKKTIAAHFDPAVSRQLKQIGIERDRSTQDLLREAINDLFAKHGKPPIA